MTDKELIEKYNEIYLLIKRYNFSKTSGALGRELRKVKGINIFISEFGFQNINHLKYYFINQDNSFSFCECKNCFNQRLFKRNNTYSLACDDRSHILEVTTLKKFNVSNIFQLESTKNKIKNTNIKKYGKEHFVLTETFKSKRMKTMELLYNDRNYNNSTKRKKTNLNKYGVDNPTKNNDILNKIKQTKLTRYGNEHYNNLDKCQQTKLKKYGNRNFNNTEKNKKTSLMNYGVTHIKKIHLTNTSDFNKEFIINNFIDDGFFLLEECCEHFNYSFSSINAFKRENGINIPNKTTKCKTQQEIFEVFALDSIPKQFNDRTIISPLELDIYYPKHKLAIEYNGLMFHSFGKSEYSMFNNYYDEKVNKFNHLNKTNLCKDREIQLLHIFENEWLNGTKREIWKSIISNKLGLIKNKVYARKCYIQEISVKTKNTFLNTNHLQGEDISKIKLGLYYNDELVSVMTFGKSRFNKNYEYELIRFANKINTNVIGGASKLFSYFKRNFSPNSIITFADKRYSDGNLYEVLGFNYLRESKPNYFYFTPSEMELKSRVQFQKHKLKDKLLEFDANSTESENMFNNGYRRIWDCGNYVYGLNL
jgi:hypothetical protein